MVLATTRYRGPYKFERRIDLAVVPCSDGEATYYATPQPEEVARWAFDQYAARSSG